MIRHELTSEIVEILLDSDGDNKGITLLGGAWGAGKTYLWEHELKRNLEQSGFPVIYVSLFGIQSISEIKNIIVTEYSMKKAGYKEVMDLIKSGAILKKLHTLGKSALNSLQNFTDLDLVSFRFDALDLVEGKCIICFDDLERRSSELDLKSVLGLISHLAEKRKMKVLVIANEDILADVESQKDEAYEYKRFAEKVISYRYKLEPSIAEFYDLLEGKYRNKNIDFFKEHKDLILSFFKNSDTNNLRTLEKAFRYIYLILKNGIDISTYQLKVFLFYIICGAEGLLSTDSREFDISSYIISKKVRGKKSETDPAKDKKEELIERFFSNTYNYSFYPALYKYVQSGQLDKANIKNELNPVENELTATQKFIKSFQNGPRLFFMDDDQLNEKYEEGKNCLNKLKGEMSAYELANLAIHLRIIRKFLLLPPDIDLDYEINNLFEIKAKSGDDSFDGSGRSLLSHYQEYWLDYVAVYEKYLDVGVSNKHSEYLTKLIADQNYSELKKCIGLNSEYFKAFVLQVRSESITECYFRNREIGFDVLGEGFKLLYMVSGEVDLIDTCREKLLEKIENLLADKRCHASDRFRMREIYERAKAHIGLDDARTGLKFSRIGELVKSMKAV